VIRRLIFACIIGCPIGVISVEALNKPFKSDALGWMASLIAAPGMIIGIAFSRGNVHTVSLGVASIANAIVYAAIAYWFLTFWERRSSKRRNGKET
jgi:hypothetical protein